MSRRAMACLSQALEGAVAEYRQAAGRAAWRRSPESALRTADAARRLEQLLGDPEIVDLLRVSFPQAQGEWWGADEPSDAPVPPLPVLTRGLIQLQAVARAYSDLGDDPASGLPKGGALRRLVGDRLALIAQAHLGIRLSPAAQNRSDGAAFAEFVESVVDVFSIRVSRPELDGAVAAAVAADQLSIA